MLPFAVALLLNSRHLRFAGLFRVLFFMPYVVPFVAGVLIWQSDAQPRQRLDRPVPLGSSAVQTRRTGSRTRRSSTRASCSSASGGSAAASSSTSPACAASRPSSTTPPGSTAPGAGRAPQRDAAADVAGHLLHADPRRSSTSSSTSSSRSSSTTGTGEPGGTTLFLNLYIYKNFFAYQNMSYGATLAWLLFAITLADHPARVPSRPALGLLRRGALSDGVGDAGRDRGRPAATAGVRHPRRRLGAATSATAARSRSRSSPSSSSPPSSRRCIRSLSRVAQDARAGRRSSTRRSGPASPVTFNYQGKDLRRLRRADRRHDEHLALVKKGRDSSQFVDPANAGRRARSPGRAPGGRSAGHGRSSPHCRELRRTSGTRSTTRGCCSTRSRSP